ncbi:MAG: chorismate mutase [Candidatus Koribacter versatilis]|uniref:chorismate mutase n=1 Tax=Candidatus Korobacter versatilis TaxID=658062 RepID=A0A932A914_9BACT|nr:chorismate mutase [Candidatus Koribacter versatilis]
MDIAEWRKKIDELDRKMVELLNERAKAAQEIGRLKRSTAMPIYEPDREKKIFENVKAVNQGPLSSLDVTQVFERIIDIMRNLQKNEIVADEKQKLSGGTEFDVDVNE